MRPPSFLWLLVTAALSVPQVGAADSGSAQFPWKLTLGEYFYSDYAGSDVNLRWRRDDTSGWVGAYVDRNFGSQVRLGADTSIDLGPYLKLQPSLQAATRGFIGGSVNLQAGTAWYGLVGIGRTDARPYFNLNFDPNDAYTLGLGHAAEGGLTYSLFVIADNRFRTGQRDWHANVQIPFGENHATLDLLRKSGQSDAGRITAWGLSANYDWPRWFARLAYDPYQNFSAESAWRVSGGMRF